MSPLWWIPASVGALCFFALLAELIILAKNLGAIRAARHPDQHEHVPGGWQ